MMLAFYKGRKRDNPGAKVFDRLVCWWTRGNYSHCELVFGDDLKDAFCCSSSFRDGGVRQKTIDLTSGRWDTVQIKDYDEARALAWFFEHYGQKYDVPGLFGFILPWRTHHPNRWFCSEACAAALGIESPHRLSPNGLLRYIQRRA